MLIKKLYISYFDASGNPVDFEKVTLFENIPVSADTQSKINEIKLEDKNFSLKSNEMILIPKTSAYTINFLEDSKAFFIRL